MEKIIAIADKYKKLYDSENYTFWMFDEYLQHIVRTNITHEERMEILLVLKYQSTMNDINSTLNNF